MRVRVIRDDGTRPAENIVDPLCTTNAVGIQRGRNLLDKESSDKDSCELEMPYRAMPATGLVIEVFDTLTGAAFKGKLVGWNHTVTAPSNNEPLKVRTSATIERSLI